MGIPQNYLNIQKIMNMFDKELSKLVKQNRPGTNSSGHSGKITVI